MNMKNRIYQWLDGEGDIPVWVGALVFAGAAVSGAVFDIVFSKIERRITLGEVGHRLELAYNAGMLKCFNGEGDELDIQKIKNLFLV